MKAGMSSRTLRESLMRSMRWKKNTHENKENCPNSPDEGCPTPMQKQTSSKSLGYLGVYETQLPQLHSSEYMYASGAHHQQPPPGQSCSVSSMPSRCHPWPHHGEAQSSQSTDLKHHAVPSPLEGPLGRRPSEPGSPDALCLKKRIICERRRGSHRVMDGMERAGQVAVNCSELECSQAVF